MKEKELSSLLLFSHKKMQKLFYAHFVMPALAEDALAPGKRPVFADKHCDAQGNQPCAGSQWGSDCDNTQNNQYHCKTFAEIKMQHLFCADGNRYRNSNGLFENNLNAYRSRVFFTDDNRTCVFSFRCSLRTGDFPSACRKFIAIITDKFFSGIFCCKLN